MRLCLPLGSSLASVLLLDEISKIVRTSPLVVRNGKVLVKVNIDSLRVSGHSSLSVLNVSPDIGTDGFHSPRNTFIVAAAQGKDSKGTMLRISDLSQVLTLLHHV